MVLKNLPTFWKKLLVSLACFGALVVHEKIFAGNPYLYVAGKSEAADWQASVYINDVPMAQVGKSGSTSLGNPLVFVLKKGVNTIEIKSKQKIQLLTQILVLNDGDFASDETMDRYFRFNSSSQPTSKPQEEVVVELKSLGKKSFNFDQAKGGHTWEKFQKVNLNKQTKRDALEFVKKIANEFKTGKIDLWFESSKMAFLEKTKVFGIKRSLDEIREKNLNTLKSYLDKGAKVVLEKDLVVSSVGNGRFLLVTNKKMEPVLRVSIYSEKNEIQKEATYEMMLTKQKGKWLIYNFK